MLIKCKLGRGTKNKGFAISSMLYTILLLFLVLLVGILGILGTRKVILDKMKSEIASNINVGGSLYLHLEYENPLVANTSMVDEFTFDPLDIVKIVDQAGNKVEGSIRYDSKPSFDSTKNGVYTVIYTGSYQGKEVTKTTTIEIINPVFYEYAYTGVEERFEAPVKGLYQFELWGAQGGSYNNTYQGGKGAYTKGNLSLDSKETLYFHVGGVGQGGTDYQYEGGYNGGGRGGYNSGGRSSGGGGATDIRLVSGSHDNFNSLKSRIMVAAGGGGFVYVTGHTNKAGAGGALTAESVTGTYNTTDPTGGSQTSGGIGKDTTKNGSFGKGGNGILNASGWGGGGGSGYYGGALGHGRGGTGGSSFISGYPGCDAILESSTESKIIHTGKPNHYSGYVFSNTIMKAGSESMPTYNHTSTMVGNSGDGHAVVISLIMDKAVVASNLVSNSGFEEGTSHWGGTTGGYSVLETNGGVLNSKHMRMISNGGTYKWLYSDLMPLPIGHKIYMAAYYKKSGGGVSRYGIYNQASKVTISLVAISENKNSWTKISQIVQNNTSANQANFLVYGAGSTDASDLEVRWDNIMVLDLTEIFGSGSEPNKEWCDQNIQYFDGTWIIPKR